MTIQTARRDGASYDETLGPDGAPSALWRAYLDWFDAQSDPSRLDMAADARRLLDEAGLSFNPFLDSKDDRTGWRFDPTPIILGGKDWETLSAGALQRAEMIDRTLADLYGPQEMIRDGLLPSSMIAAPEFIRAAARWPQAPRWRVFLYSVDVARRADGVWVVLDDHVDRPEGMGWTLANRIALSQAASEPYLEISPRRLGGFFNTMQEMLESEAHSDGRIALLTAGSGDPAYFSHAYMARYLGLTLVEPGDLTAREGESLVKTLEGLRRVDVALRGAPSLGIDPIYAPGPSALAPPGVLAAARAGATLFANMVGAGVLDGRALAPWSTALTRRLLDADPILVEADFLDLGDPSGREAYLADPDPWAVGPLRETSRPGGRERPDIFAGLGAEARARKLARDGWRLIARGATPLARAPAFETEPEAGGGARLTQRPYALRLFVVRGPGGYEIMPGGLAQSSPTPSARAMPWAGEAKDVWIVEDSPEAAPAATDILSVRRRSAHLRRTGRDLLSRVADNLFWLGRYVERAETSLRILKLVLDRVIDAPRRHRQPELLGDLLGLHLAGDSKVHSADDSSLRAGILRLALDPTEGYGLRQSLDGVYRNAAETRAHLSRDAWRDVGALCSDPVWRRDPATARPFALVGPIDEGIRALAAFSGASHENMTRNYAWRFLELGRRLERGLQMSGMFSTLMIEPREDEPAALYALLQLCDSFFAYRARYMITPEAAPTLDLLALDENNPRSMAFQLVALEAAIAQLPVDGHTRSPAHKIAISLLTEFQISDAPTLAALGPGDRRTTLAGVVDQAETGLDRIGELVAAAHFAHAEPAMTQIAMGRSEREPAT